MTDQEYVESTVEYIAEHVTWMLHEFVAWVLREVCKDQPSECLLVADLHDRWNEVGTECWSSAESSAMSVASSLAGLAQESRENQDVMAPFQPAALAAGAAAFSTPTTTTNSASTTEATLEMAAAGEELAWSRMAAWLREHLTPHGHPPVSADWWEERGESKLAELLRQQAAETSP